MQKTQVLKVVLRLPSKDLFDYLPPLDNPNPALGSRLLVPFGASKRIGVLVRFGAQTVPDSKLKRVIQCLAEVALDRVDYAIRLWMARYYAATLSEVFIANLPKKLRQATVASDLSSLLVTNHWHVTGKPPPKRLGNKQKLLYEYLQTSAQSQASLTKAGINQTTLRSAVQGGWAGCHAVALRAPTAPQQPLPALTTEQLLVWQRFNTHSGFGVHLLFGITASGKTRLYLEIIHYLVNKKNNTPVQVLLLAPEAGLVDWLVTWLAPMVPIAVVGYHYALTESQRARVWLQAETQSMLIIGTRSAVFLPSNHWRLIIVDEEHDNAYKQQNTKLRYHARDTAIAIAKKRNIPVVLGSATPALVSWHHAQQGKYQLYPLRVRASALPLSQMRLLDMSALRADQMIHPQAMQQIKTTLQAGNKVLLFINRRGFAPRIFCAQCNWQALCISCSSHLVWHKHLHVLVCHHCGYRTRRPESCPSCQQAKIVHIGAGTQRIEAFTQSHFADYPLMRLDKDSLGKKGALATQLRQLQKQQAAIIVATQMFTKGYNIANLQLVVVLDADGGFFSTDPQALENTAQTIIQVAGRSGRSKAGAQVLTQTRFFDHPLWQGVVMQDYTQVANTLLQERKKAHLFPFKRMLLLSISHVESNQAQSYAKHLCALIDQKSKPERLLGPLPATPEKRKNRYYWQTIIISNLASLQKIKAVVSTQTPPIGTGVLLDVDPVDLSYS